MIKRNTNSGKKASIRVFILQKKLTTLKKGFTNGIKNDRMYLSHSNDYKRGGCYNERLF